MIHNSLLLLNGFANRFLLIEPKVRLFQQYVVFNALRAIVGSFLMLYFSAFILLWIRFTQGFLLVKRLIQPHILLSSLSEDYNSAKASRVYRPKSTFTVETQSQLKLNPNTPLVLKFPRLVVRLRQPKVKSQLKLQLENLQVNTRNHISYFISFIVAGFI
jgi:hypothetical protein